MLYPFRQIEVGQIESFWSVLEIENGGEFTAILNTKHSLDIIDY